MLVHCFNICVCRFAPPGPARCRFRVPGSATRVHGDRLGNFWFAGRMAERVGSHRPIASPPSCPRFPALERASSRHCRVEYHAAGLGNLDPSPVPKRRIQHIRCWATGRSVRNRPAVVDGLGAPDSQVFDAGREMANQQIDQSRFAWIRSGRSIP